MLLYVKKIWSLNPDKYKFVELEKAIFEHYKWVREDGGDKTFKEWLKTEI
jgi:hypothetical protein